MAFGLLFRQRREAISSTGTSTFAGRGDIKTTN